MGSESFKDFLRDPLTTVRPARRMTKQISHSSQTYFTTDRGRFSIAPRRIFEAPHHSEVPRPLTISHPDKLTC